MCRIWLDVRGLWQRTGWLMYTGVDGKTCSLGRGRGGRGGGVPVYSMQSLITALMCRIWLDVQGLWWRICQSVYTGVDGKTRSLGRGCEGWEGFPVYCTQLNAWRTGSKTWSLHSCVECDWMSGNCDGEHADQCTLGWMERPCSCGERGVSVHCMHACMCAWPSRKPLSLRWANRLWSVLWAFVTAQLSSSTSLLSYQ